MQDKQQFEQLIMQYNQLLNGAYDIRKMIENEDLDSAITMLKAREELFLSCKCMRKFLDLSVEEEQELNALLDKLRELELENIKLLSTGMDEVRMQLKKAQQNEKILHAYDFDENQKGSIINYTE